MREELKAVQGIHKGKAQTQENIKSPSHYFKGGSKGYGTQLVQQTQSAIKPVYNM